MQSADPIQELILKTFAAAAQGYKVGQWSKMRSHKPWLWHAIMDAESRIDRAASKGTEEMDALLKALTEYHKLVQVMIESVHV